MKIDYSMADSGAKVLPGEYEVKVVNYEVKTSTSGNQCVQLDYEIRNDVNQDCQGLKILYDNFTFTDSAMWRICAAAKAAGIPDGFEIPDEHPEQFGEAMKNRYLKLVVQDRTYNDKTYPSVKEFWPTATQVKQPPVPKMDSHGFVPARDDFMTIPDGVDETLPFN